MDKTIARRKHRVEFLDVRGNVIDADVASTQRYYIHLPAFGLLLHSKFLGELLCFDMCEVRLQRARSESGIDWRLPSAPESSIIADLSVYQPCMPQGFEETRGKFWTSTPCAWDDQQRYLFEVMTGTLSYAPRTEFANLLAVASHIPTP